MKRPGRNRRHLSARQVGQAILLVLAFAGAVLVAAWLDPGPSTAAGRGVASDGDSLRIGDIRIRLLGIDAPELAQTCTDRAGLPWPCGVEAREAMRRMLSAGEIACSSAESDRFGRLLATCSIGGHDLGARIVEAGWAISTEGYGREQAAARAARRGIWQGAFESPRAWRDAHP